MEKIIVPVTVDLFGKTKRRAMEAHQGERGIREVQVTIEKNGEAWAPPEDWDYIAQIRKPNGNTVFVKCTLEGGTVRFTIPGNGVNVPGIAVAEIVINKSEDRQSAVTQAWEIEIHPGQGDANAIEASDDLESMEKRISANTALLEKLVLGQRVLYGFEIDEEGHLILTYEGEDPPRYYIDSRGHLMAGVDDGNEIDLGNVRCAGQTMELGYGDGILSVVIRNPDGTMESADLHDGFDPYINAEGNWQTRSGDTGVRAQGKTPEKGVDYWTEEDKAEIVAQVLAAIQA